MDRIERTVVLEAPRDEVWAALTRPERLSSWFGGRTEIELKPGGRLTVIGEGWVRRGLVERVEPPSRLTFRWLPEPGMPSAIRTRVELTLHDEEGRTTLTVVEGSLWSERTASEPERRVAVGP